LAAPLLRAAPTKPRRMETLRKMEMVMGPLPSRPRSAPSIEVQEETKIDNLIRQRLTYSVEDGDAVPAYMFVPDTKKRKAAVVCLHQTTRIGKAEPAGFGPKENLHYALELAKRGLVTLAPDYPNFGDYKIDVYSRGYASATMKGIVNHMRAVDLLAAHPQVKAKHIGAIGHSLGGHNALFLAAFDERVKAVVTSCGFTAFAKYYKGDLTGWSHPGYMPRIASMYHKSPAEMPFDFPDVLSAIAPRALFVNAPVNDANFDVSGVKDCLAAVKDQFPAAKLIARYPDSEHDFPLEVRQKAYRFLESSLEA
jgi:dienelactone hydrolase